MRNRLRCLQSDEQLHRAVESLKAQVIAGDLSGFESRAEAAWWVRTPTAELVELIKLGRQGGKA